MKICVIQSFSLSDHLAISSALTELIDSLTMKNHKVSAVVIKGKSKNNKEVISRPDLVDFHEVESNNYSIFGNILFAIKARKILKSIIDNSDIILARYPFSSLLSLLFLKNKTRVVYDIRSLWVEMMIEKISFFKFFPGFFKKTLYKIEIYLINKLTKGLVFLNYNTSLNYSKNGLNIKNFKIAHTLAGSTDSNLFKNTSSRILHQKFHLSDNDFIIGYIGSLQKMRKIDFFVESFNKHKNEMPKNIKLLIIGDGNGIDDLFQLVKKYKLSDRIFISHSFKRRLVPKIISEFNIGLSHLPRRFVFDCSSPMKIFEYAFCEVPILASDSPAHKQFEKYIPTLFFYSDYHNFSMVLNDMYRNFEKISKDLSESRKLLSDRFNNNVLSNQLDDLLSSVIKK